MEFDFGTWNVRTLNKTGALRSLLLLLEKYDIAITALQETKWTHSGIMDLRTHTILSSGSSNGRREFGVAFIVEKKMKSLILDFKPVSNRICTLRIKTRLHNISLINVHAPTEDKADEEKEEFYQELTNAIRLIPSNDIKMVLGDMNAKVGKEEEFLGVIGKHSLHNATNDNGSRLIDFASSNSMVVSSTMFPHKNIHKMTWQSPDRVTKNQIDHVLIERRGATSILDVRSMKGACCASDHYLVKVKFRTRITTKIHRGQTQPKYDIDKLKLEERRDAYQNAVVQNLGEAEGEQPNINDKWEQIKSSVKGAAEEALGWAPRQTRIDWFDQDCRAAIEERNQSHREYIARPTRARMEVFKQKRRTADKLCRKKKREYLNRRILQIQEDFNEGRIRQAYKGTRQIINKFQPRTDICKDIDGNLLADPDKIKERWREYFQNLLNPTPIANEDQQAEAFVIPQDNISIEPPTLDEVREAVKRQKSNKSPGIDGIAAELLKEGGPQLLATLHQLICSIWEEEVIPDDWKKAIICPIYKKGDKLTCKNYRGISLLSTSYKTFTILVKQKLEPIAESLIGEYQAGFRTNRSTSDQLLTLKQILEKTWERNIDIYQIFVDFQQAYDSINRERLYRILLELGVPSKLVRLIKCATNSSLAKVRIQNAVTEEFEVRQGLRQGDGLAPMLFNLALEWVIRKTSVQRNASIATQSVQLLGYADDVNIVGRSFLAAKEVYVELKEAAKDIGLNINEEKTKVMQQSRAGRFRIGRNITIDEHNLEVVDKTVYLGSTITKRNEEKEEVTRRILLANRAFYAQKQILHSRFVHRKTKLSLYKTVIRPVLCYGSETWTMTQDIEERVNRFERKVLRCIIGPTREDGIWRRRYNNELYEVFDDPELSTFIKINRLRLAGHVIRMDDNRIPKRLMVAEISGNRPVGRPRRRWIDSVTADAEAMLNIRNWRHAARDRQSWRNALEEAKARFGL